MKDMKASLRTIHQHLWTDAIIVLLALISVILLLLEFFTTLSSEQINLLRAIDISIAYIFLAEFLLGTWLAEKRLTYVRQNWTDLLASIPFSQFDVLRGLRLLRILKIVAVTARVKKSVSAIRRVYISNFLYLAVVLTILILFSSVIFYLFELEPNQDVNSFFDAVWWAVVTSSTIGYGDIVPITTAGRIISMVLAFVGVGLAGAIGGMVASFFINQKQ